MADSKLRVPVEVPPAGNRARDALREPVEAKVLFASSPEISSSASAPFNADVFFSSSRSTSTENEPLVVSVQREGSTKAEPIEGLCPETQLFELHAKVMRAFGSPPESCLHELADIGSLWMGSTLLRGSTKTLRELGLSGQVQLVFVQTRDLLTLQVGDGSMLQVARDIACVSRRLHAAVEHHGIFNVFQLPEVSLPMLRKVLTYCAYHRDNPAPPIKTHLLLNWRNGTVPSSNLQQCDVCAWDCDFIDIAADLFVPLIAAANVLHVEPLCDLACAKVGSEIRKRGMGPLETRKHFSIVHDSIPEDEVRTQFSKCPSSRELSTFVFSEA